MKIGNGTDYVLDLPFMPYSLIVTLNEDGTQASHTPAEMWKHLQNGGSVYLDLDGSQCRYSLSNIWYNENYPEDAIAEFAAVGTEENRTGGYFINGSGATTYHEWWFATQNDIAPLIVTITRTDEQAASKQFTSSHTATALCDHIRGYGSHIYLEDNGEMFHLISTDYEQAIFSSGLKDDLSQTVYIIDEFGNGEIFHQSYPVSSVNGKTGSVSLSASDVDAYSKTEIDNM